ncbi:GrpB family protein [Nocardioides sp.]|uniref:GrpB family protein n=1 Tax=Nocardioides sp. TaxID=35761 RepID=UPI001A253D62|nr:GrpB family protein [Nocardioides sp.]MBJ7356135.1 GrpB family protein [Nocardioides sp.]
MPTHPLWRPFALTDLEVDVVVTRLPPAKVVVVPYDDGWPEAYAQVERVVRGVLGDVVLAIEHTGSTSVPGLAAKPVVDVVLTVPDPDPAHEHDPQPRS